MVHRPRPFDLRPHTPAPARHNPAPPGPRLSFPVPIADGFDKMGNYLTDSKGDPMCHRSIQIDLTVLEASNDPVAKEAAKKLIEFLTGEIDSPDLTDEERAALTAVTMTVDEPRRKIPNFVGEGTAKTRRS